MTVSHAIDTWRKSSYSANTDNCVEVAHIHPAVAMRDSKNPTGPVLTLRPLVFAAFMSIVKEQRS